MEIRHKRVIKIARKAARADVPNIRVIHGRGEDALARLFKPANIHTFFIHFPDPWPKKKHHRRRFVTPDHLEPLARVLKPGAIFRVATDIPDYVRQTLEEVPRHGFEWLAETPEDWRSPWDDWISTRYEQKALREGRTPHYLTFRKR